ncbi:uncharacterized protein TRUGW13939_04344 [Talaromyces rugulosus]|uniref:AB hydrolase-1 domain-containing protein n=1 Tax=Talaromyces rugulosus TaxID=121627 RepID=A0A7H8QTX1_TALRU|nr:uncharacterized protein TRUGW13939_04344 [Talaromyces rugulosus]QKX57236.1 hypothetical protein TRUGW13939_04344 [Talaromyces rugulosus]
MATTAPWTLTQHIIPAFHPRAYRRSVRDPEASRLVLHVNEYTIALPAQQSQSEKHGEKKNGITIIFAHGVGSTKEQYEPFFHDLLSSVPPGTVKAIFAADVYNHGQSFLLNKNELGDDAEWLDPARDIVTMINHFAAQRQHPGGERKMSPPLVGIGQSWGAVHVLAPAAWHPRMFQAVVCIEPIVENGSWHDTSAPQWGVTGRGTGFKYRLHKIQDSWENEAAARKSLTNSPYYGLFDKRVFEKMIQTDLYRPDPSRDRVELVTPKLQRIVWFLRPDPPYKGIAPTEDYATRTEMSRLPGGFYRPECDKIKSLMTGIHCKTLYVWSRDEMWVSDGGYRQRVVGCTGTGLGGGGGAALG